jgi:ATP-dependent Clp protease ATP-binding subunit ClpA
MFERFTTDARQVVFGARSLAITRGDSRIGALHLLSALTTVSGSSPGGSVAARVLAGAGVDAAAVGRVLGPGTGRGTGMAPGTDAEALASIGIDLDEIRRKVEQSFGEGALNLTSLDRAGSPILRGYTAFTDDAKSTLALAVKEAQALHHHYIGTEHLLLGLLRTADPAGRRGHGGLGLRQALNTLGLSFPVVRDQVLALLTTA